MSLPDSIPFETSVSLESPLSDALPPTTVPKLEISSSEFTSADGPPAKVRKLDISSSESMSSEGTPLNGKALMHEVGIETDSKMLTDHSCVTPDSEDDDSYDEDGSEHESTDSEDDDSYDKNGSEHESTDSEDDDSYDEESTDSETYRIEACGVFDISVFPDKHLCGAISPIIPLEDYTRERLKPLCIAAIDHFNENAHKRYEFVKLVKANCQLVSGRMYYLTLDAYNPEDGSNQTFQAVVWDRIPKVRGVLNLTVRSCELKTLP